MLLKSLELHGFKTFPDKTKLSFNEGITAVVGPNGSGKSNISDAIRWVLGEQSVKALRCSKMEDVIFGGTPTRKSQGFSEVTLTIDNKSRRLPFDNDDVAISRRYYRSGESEYLINKAVVRLKDINELFMDTGLGKDGYSMISQGKIDSIVSSRSEDRREIFEEAAGISRFKYRKLEAQKKLAQAEENLLRLKDILKELEERVGPLKEQASKAKEYIDLANEKRSLEIGIWLDVLNKSGAILNDHQAKIAVASGQHQEIEDDIEKIQKETEEIFLKSNSISAIIEESRKQISILEEQANQKISKASVLENDILHNDENIKRIENEICEIRDSFENIDSKILERKERIDKTNSFINEKQSSLEEANIRYQNLKSNLEEFSSNLDSLSKELSDLKLSASNKKVSILTLESSIEDLKLRYSRFDTVVDDYKTRISKLEKALLDYNEMANESKSKIDYIENSIKGYEIKLSNKKQKSTELKKESDKLSLDAESKIRRIRILEDLERNLEGFAQSVKSVMKEAKNGAISGVHGPISKIIKVESKFSIALEIALGASMQNIVVETEADAKNAIAVLKRKNLGRATFLPISTIKGKFIDKKDFENLDGYVGIAYELCSYDKQYDEIVKSLLGRIIVAENLNCATEIAKRFNYRFKVVTLDGQVVNAGGSLTGGSMSKNAGILSRTSEIERLKTEAEDLKQRANKSYMAYKETEAAIYNLESIILGSKGDLSRAKEDHIRILAECRNVNSEKESVSKLLLNNENEKTETFEKIEQSKCSFQRAKDDYRIYLTKIDEVEEKISGISGDKDSISKDREELIEQIQQLKLAILTAQKDNEALNYEIRSMEDSKLHQNQRINSLENQITYFKNKSKKIVSDIATLNKESQELKKMAKAENKKITDNASKKIGFEKRSAELRQVERDRSLDKEKISKELARLEEQKSGIQKEYDAIIAKLWEEYELTRREAEETVKRISDIHEAKRILNEIKLKIKKLGSINIAAIEEYKEVSSRYEFMKEQIDDIEKSKTELTKLTLDLTKQMRELFEERFKEINTNFMSTFKELFGGGRAELMLTDPSDVLSSGIEISVEPPGKIVAHLEALSGGEKALVAIALYFAIMKVSPAPFCVLDEIEAALDDVNVYRYAAYLRKMNANTQFIVITHRRGTMEEADVLYGVTMQDEGVSRLLELKVSELEQNRELNNINKG